VRGKDPEKRKTLLSFLLRELDELHEETKGIEVEKRVPCICGQCQGIEHPYFHEHAYLEELKADGIGEERCKKSKKMVSVAALLGNVFVQHKDEKVVDEINKWLAEDDIDMALALLKQLNEGDAVLLSGEWADLKKAYLRGGGISEGEFHEKKKSLRFRIQDFAGQSRKRGF
jgi:hypothetical protein